MTAAQTLDSAVRVLFAGPDGRLRLVATSDGGHQVDDFEVPVAPIADHGLPAFVWDNYLAHGYELDVAPVVRRTNGTGLWPCLFAVWRPSTTFDRRGRDRVTDEGVTRIREALAGAPRATIIVDAGPVVWAAWRLREPLSASPEAELMAFGQRMQADTRLPPDIPLPLAGPVRAWPGQGSAIRIVAFDGGVLYNIDDLIPNEGATAHALTGSSTPGRRNSRSHAARG